MENLTVGPLVVEPGGRVHGDLRIVNTDRTLPVSLLHGRSPGKKVTITAGIHGGEYVGINTAIRLATDLDPGKMAGSLMIVRVANIDAFYEKTQYRNPTDGKNLNRMFPGKAMGSISERIAHTISTELHAQSDFYMDLHGGDIHEDLTDFVIYPRLGSEETTRTSREMAALMGIEYVVGSVSETGTFGSAAKNYGVPGFLGEIGGCGVWTTEQVDKYCKGVRNVLTALGVLEGVVEKKSCTFLHKVVGTSSGEHGCWHPAVTKGETVKAGQALGEVQDLLGKTLELHRSEVDGIVLYVASSLAVQKGDPLVATGIPE